MSRSNSRRNPQSPLKPAELAIVTGVGIGLSFFGQSLLGPLALGTGLYVLGVYIGSQKRPDAGWLE